MDNFYGLNLKQDKQNFKEKIQKEKEDKQMQLRI